MKNLYFLFFCCVAWCNDASAQFITVRDYTNSDPINNAVIKDRQNNTSRTGPDGKASVSNLNINDTVWISHPDFFVWDGMVNSVSDVWLMSRAINLNEVVLSAQRSEDTLKNIPFQMNIINQRQIEFANPQTAADILQNSGVTVQKSQMGGGSPIIRGFEANRVLIVVDGVRMNNAIFRAGHLHDVISLDASMIEKTEIVFGPSSTVYGSDALGGVMHFFTKSPKFSTDEKMLLKANVMARYSTANNEKTGHFDLNFGFKKIAFLTNVTWSDFDDLRAGRFRNRADTAFGKRYYYAERINGKDTMLVNENPELQKFSGYKQINLMQRIAYKQNENTVHGLNIQFSTTSNVPRYDRLTEMSGGKLKFAEWYYGPQMRLFGAYNLTLSGKTKLYNNARITAAWQQIRQQRITRKFDNPFRDSQTEDVGVASINADFAKGIGERNDVKYGLEFTYNDVKSKAETKDIVADTTGKAATRYPDGGSSYMTAAAYVTDNIRLNDVWMATVGLRYNYVQMQNKFVDTVFYPFPFSDIKQQNMAVTGNAGVVYKPGNGWQLNGLLATGFRSPNVDDISKVFESGGGILIVPNDKLKPEYTWNTELGINKIIDDKLKLNAVFFYTVLNNAIVLKDFQYKGQDSVIYSGSMNKVQALQNADQAFVYGYSFSAAWDIDRSFSIKSILNYTHGTYYITEKRYYVPLDHIAPLNGQTGLNYKARKFEGEFFTRFSAAKRLEDYSPSGEDNLKFATANGMPGWWTLNIRAAYQVAKHVRATFSIENITDNHYRVFASGISAPGRNFIFSLRYKL